MRTKKNHEEHEGGISQDGGLFCVFVVSSRLRRSPREEHFQPDKNEGYPAIVHNYMVKGYPRNSRQMGQLLNGCCHHSMGRAHRTLTLHHQDGDAMAKRKRKKKKLKFLIIFLLLAGGGYALYHFRMAGKKAEEVDTPISLKKGAVVDRLTETGKVEYERIVEVKSAISGRVKTLFVDDGQEVNANDVMAIIGPDPDQALRLSEAAVSVQRSRIVW